MPSPQTVLSCSYATRATLSNKCKTFSTFVNVKHKVISSKQTWEKVLTQLKSLKINREEEGSYKSGRVTGKFKN